MTEWDRLQAEIFTPEEIAEMKRQATAMINVHRQPKGRRRLLYRLIDQAIACSAK